VTVLLSLLAALSYGLSDFNGGIFSKRGGPWAVSLMAQLSATVVVLVVALVDGGDPTGADLVWAVAAGVGNGFGTAFLYRGLSSGRMGVVAPVSGVGAVLVPVVVGVLTGERPGPLVWIGVVLALPAIWLVSREPTDTVTGDVPRGSGLVDGVLAGLGFGALFAALAQIRPEAGFLPLAVNVAVAGVAIVAVAATLRQSWVPSSRWALGGIISGVLGAMATGLFQVAVHHGLLSVAAVITSLYPAFTVVLAALVLRERMHGAQGVGLALCAASVALVAAG
jgi:drug/metabolite transporter (DMT)-like permease